MVVTESALIELRLKIFLLFRVPLDLTSHFHFLTLKPTESWYVSQSYPLEGGVGVLGAII